LKSATTEQFRRLYAAAPVERQARIKRAGIPQFSYEQIAA